MPANALLTVFLAAQTAVASTNLFPGANAPKQASSAISTLDVALWGMGLVIVLGLFFLCVWILRKLSGGAINGGEKIRILSGLSLGLREKIILLQVGKKQLVLGVTPNRIETLLVLEGEDCLRKEDNAIGAVSRSFSQQLAQVMKGRADG